MKFETRLNENKQVMIPSYYVKKYDLDFEDIVEWMENSQGEIIVKFKKNVHGD